MRSSFTSGFCIIVLILIAGCTAPQRGISDNGSKIQTVQTIPADATTPLVIPSGSITVPSSPVVRPQKVMVTLGPLKAVKDPELWFYLQVPESWVVTSERISIPEGYMGLIYETSLYNNAKFHILTYAITRNQDQDLRNYYRSSWTPHPNESTVMINGITFDRFESKSGADVSVAYVVRKGSANERGLASVIEYSIDSSGPYPLEDFESLISTFHYVAADEINDIPGEEIKRPDGIPLFR
jgi:hypothetical protein